MQAASTRAVQGCTVPGNGCIQDPLGGVLTNMDRRGTVDAGAMLLWAAGLATLPAASLHGAQAAIAYQREFLVYLQDRLIGTHRFEITAPGPGGVATVRSTASFDVKILGLTAYRYRHVAVEQWRDGCLLALESRTDDNGHSMQATTGPGGRGCLMSYAYWDRRILTQRHLLNPQTGALDAVQVEERGAQQLDVGGTLQEAVHYRLTSAQLSIDLWYSPDGQWLQLDSTTRDGRQLRYRLN